MKAWIHTRRWPLWYSGLVFEDIKQQLLVAKTLVEIVAIWILSDIGYYLLRLLPGTSGLYSNYPVVMALYYMFWVWVAFRTFRSLYQNWRMVEVRTSMFVLIGVALVGVFCYVVYVLPAFPPIHWAYQWTPPSELLYASPWYFLPKSIDIALQQLLIAAMVLVFELRKWPIKTIAAWSAGLFGGIHLLLVFGGSSLAYTFFFTASAVVAGYIFPYLMLRVRNGFLYSYFLHWGFYAAVIVLARFIVST